MTIQNSAQNQDKKKRNRSNNVEKNGTVIAMKNSIDLSRESSIKKTKIKLFDR